MILKVGKREVTCFSFDGGGTVGCVRYQSIELDYVSRWFSRHHLCEFNCPRKSQQLHFGLISAVIIGYFGLVTRYMRKFFYKASILLWTLQALCSGFGLARWLGSSNRSKSFKRYSVVVCLFTWLLIGVAAYILLGFVNDAQQTLGNHVQCFSDRDVIDD